MRLGLGAPSEATSSERCRCGPSKSHGGRSEMRRESAPPTPAASGTWPGPPLPALRDAATARSACGASSLRCEVLGWRRSGRPSRLPVRGRLLVRGRRRGEPRDLHRQRGGLGADAGAARGGHCEDVHVACGAERAWRGRRAFGFSGPGFGCDLATQLGARSFPARWWPEARPPTGTETRALARRPRHGEKWPRARGAAWPRAVPLSAQPRGAGGAAS